MARRLLSVLSITCLFAPFTCKNESWPPNQRQRSRSYNAVELLGVGETIAFFFKKNKHPLSRPLMTVVRGLDVF